MSNRIGFRGTRRRMSLRRPGTLGRKLPPITSCIKDRPPQTMYTLSHIYNILKIFDSMANQAIQKNLSWPKRSSPTTYIISHTGILWLSLWLCLFTKLVHFGLLEEIAQNWAKLKLEPLSNKTFFYNWRKIRSKIYHKLNDFWTSRTNCERLRSILCRLSLRRSDSMVSQPRAIRSPSTKIVKFLIVVALIFSNVRARTILQIS